MFHKTVYPLAAALFCLPGCVENQSVSPQPAPPPLTTEPIGLQMTRAEPRLAGLPFRVLLDFERPTDMAFVTSQSAALTPSIEKAHTGRGSLKVDRRGV